MPYKFETDKKLIPKELNLTRKLTEEERKEIKSLYGTISQRQLAKRYNVSRRLIIFIGCPEKAEKNKEQFSKRQKTGKYYDREKHNLSVQKMRTRKLILNKQGKLI